MLIKELHPDIERYLLQDCYCQHEIYSFDGIFYQLFYEDQECAKIGETIGDDKGIHVIACLAHPEKDEKEKLQIILFFIDGTKCCDALRYDATVNNIEITKFILANGLNAYVGCNKKYDEYEPGSTVKGLQELLNIADAIEM